MKFKDYYKSLGLEKGADAAAIKKAYRKLAGKYHPDKNPGNKQAEDRFKEINEANEVLGDPTKKQRYDTLGPDWEQTGSPRQSRRPGQQGFSSADMGDAFGGGQGGFSDFFESMFGGGGGSSTGPFRQARQKGEDYQADIEITLEDAFHGAQKVIEVGGRKLKLAFKPGISEGRSVKLAGQGAAGVQGGPDGDFYLKIHVAPHAVFERRGDDLHQELPVDFLTAVVGSKLEVSTLKGPVKVSIPPLTNHGKVLRLKGRGMPLYDNPENFGDLYLKVVLALPSDLNEKEIEQLAAMAKARN